MAAQKIRLVFTIMFYCFLFVSLFLSINALKELFVEQFYIVLPIKLVCFALFQRRTIDDLLLLSAIEEEDQDSDVETLLLDLVVKEPRPFKRSFRIDFETLDDQECINLFRCENKTLTNINLSTLLVVQV